MDSVGAFAMRHPCGRPRSWVGDSRSKLIHSVIASLDGYVADESGNFDWAEPDAAVHSFINDLERSVGTYLCGRRMYEVMQVWQTLGGSGNLPPHIQDFAKLWRAADKVVYSSTLSAVSTPRTRIGEAGAVVPLAHERGALLGGTRTSSGRSATAMADGTERDSPHGPHEPGSRVDEPVGPRRAIDQAPGTRCPWLCCSWRLTIRSATVTTAAPTMPQPPRNKIIPM
jgi:hypothetical protein